MKSGKRASGHGQLGFLAGRGEMGERIRAFDWSKTPIGPIESWSPALRTMVSILLANRFPLLLWWGPQYIQIYNDPYRPIPGAKHPDRALGRPASQCWSEIWHVIGPLIDTPFQGGPATWMDDILLEIHRHGFTEESHFTIAYSPVPDDTVASGIGGVLATVHEITEKVIGERRVVALRDLGARMTEAKTAEEVCRNAAAALTAHDKDIPFALLYLVDSEGKRARLAGACGVDMGETIRPLSIDLTEPNAAGWPLAEVQRSEAAQVVQDLHAHFGDVPPGPWSDPPQMAVVLPIRSHKAHEPAGLLVAGISARLKLDEFYRSFLDLLAAQVATAIANARAYEEEKKRAEALAEIDRAKTAFFSNVSHEFRTPLTLMLGPLEDTLANAHGILSRNAAATLTVAHRNSLRLLKLVNSLLDFSRIEAGRVQANYEPVDLAAYTAELASVFRAAIERAKMRLIVSCPPLPEVVYVDRDMWEKIVLNLLSNAFKYTLKGEIELRLGAVDGQARLTVRDTGVGIPSEEIPRMFERFHRVKESRGRTYEGTGIGLALVQELVKLHGGTVRVDSVFGEGSTFTVTMPFGKAHLDPQRIAIASGLASTAIRSFAFVEEALRWLPDAEQELGQTWDRKSSPLFKSPETTPPPGSVQPPARRGRILLADDNADMRGYVRRLLCQRFEVEAVADGQAALEAARARPPDLVLTDIMMPRLDGFGLLRELRADPSTAEIPVLILSARAGEESRVEGMQAGADDYLVKPFSARELMARVDAHVKMARMRREATEALRKGEERLSAFLEQLPMGVGMCDPQGRWTICNPIFGRFMADWIASPDHDETWPARSRAAGGLPVSPLQSPVARALRGETVSPGMDFLHTSEDGAEIWLHVSAAPFRNEAGEVTGAIVVLQDITGK